MSRFKVFGPLESTDQVPEWYAIVAVAIVLTVLLSLKHDEVVHFCRPIIDKIRKWPAGFMIPILLLVIVSFPPLVGHESESSLPMRSSCPRRTDHLAVALDQTCVPDPITDIRSHRHPRRFGLGSWPGFRDPRGGDVHRRDCHLDRIQMVLPGAGPEV